MNVNLPIPPPIPTTFYRLFCEEQTSALDLRSNCYKQIHFVV